jgi:hypothetical protein
VKAEFMNGLEKVNHGMAELIKGLPRCSCRNRTCEHLCHKIFTNFSNIFYLVFLLYSIKIYISEPLFNYHANKFKLNSITVV